jgi:hypothetical protein
VTHPFHPLVGKRLELLTQRKTWGEDRVFFHDGERLRGVPAGWTDAVEPPAFVTLAAGRAHFRPDDLVRLCELLHGLQPARKTSASEKKAARKVAGDTSREFRRNRKAKIADTECRNGSRQSRKKRK